MCKFFIDNVIFYVTQHLCMGVISNDVHVTCNIQCIFQTETLQCSLLVLCIFLGYYKCVTNSSSVCLNRSPVPFTYGQKACHSRCSLTNTLTCIKLVSAKHRALGPTDKASLYIKSQHLCSAFTAFEHGETLEDPLQL